MPGYFSFEERGRRYEQIQLRFIDLATRICSIFLYEAFNISGEYDAKLLTESGTGFRRAKD